MAGNHVDRNGEARANCRARRENHEMAVAPCERALDVGGLQVLFAAEIEPPHRKPDDERGQSDMDERNVGRAARDLLQ